MKTLNDIKVALLKPIQGEGDYGDYHDFFNPWDDVFPMFMGVYNSCFNTVAIDLMTKLRDRSFESPKENELAYQMLQEILCQMDLCTYGGSPRGSWAEPDFLEILPALVAKWREYAHVAWEDDDFLEALSADQQMQVAVAYQKCGEIYA